MANREKLPGIYETRYKDEDLKAKIADIGMWSMIPAVRDKMNSKAGIQRLKENDPLFLFIDKYFADKPYAFEPNMQDGRFVFLPDDVSHQGVGICASRDYPGFFDVANFWYPCEFTEKKIAFGPGQVYVSMFSSRPEQLVDVIQNVYMDQKNPKHEHYCTFLFDPDIIVTLKGDFLDRLDQSVKEIRDALKNRTPVIQRNGEGLIQFMQRIMSE